MARCLQQSALHGNEVAYVALKFAMKSIPLVPLQTPPAMVFIAYLLVGGVILSCILSFLYIYFHS